MCDHDSIALAAANDIALMWGQDRNQFVSKIQVRVRAAIRAAIVARQVEIHRAAVNATFMDDFICILAKNMHGEGVFTGLNADGSPRYETPRQNDQAKTTRADDRTVSERIINWLRRNANASNEPVERATFIEAHNAAKHIQREAERAQNTQGDDVIRLQAVIERDRTAFCGLIVQLKQELQSRSWLGDENARAAGGYTYDEPGFIREFGDAWTAIMKALERAHRTFQDFTDCPRGDAMRAAQAEAQEILDRQNTQGEAAAVLTAKLHIAHEVLTLLKQKHKISDQEMDKLARDAQRQRQDWPGEDYWRSFYAPLVSSYTHAERAMVPDDILRTAETLRNELHYAACRAPDGWDDEAAEWQVKAQALLDYFAAAPSQPEDAQS
jgi:hypothetical protein